MDKPETLVPYSLLKKYREKPFSFMIAFKTIFPLCSWSPRHHFPDWPSPSRPNSKVTLPMNSSAY